MTSPRLPATLEPNEWARRLAARRAAGGADLDLTESNPTRVGLGGASGATLLALADPLGALYQPEPRGLAVAREAVAGYYGARGTPISPEHVVITTGTSESYAHLFRLLAAPGDAVLTPAPSYPLFEPIAALEGIEAVPYRLAFDGAWHLDLASLDAALDRAGRRARALVVVEPNHPTGSLLAEAERAALETRLASRDLALISDEVFSDFGWAPGPPALPGWLGGRRIPTFVLGGLSKCCGMPQLKLGWIAVAGPEPRTWIEGLDWIGDLFLSVGTPVQLALPALLEARHDYQARVRARLERNRAALAALTRAHPEVSVLPGRGGWTALLRLPASRGREWSLELLERDVVIHPGHFYDLERDDDVVASLVVEPERFAAALARVADALVNS